MLVDKRHDITVQGNLDGQKVAMTFDENSLSHIYSILIDMYSDTELAVIREYSTNALDSHVEAGQTRPIEVTLPSPLSPFFKVKDFGVGLSVDEVVNIYSKYGASTKRESNDFNGMLGIGGKSALTYTSQFNVTAIKEGVKIQISVSRSEDGAATMEIVDTVSTTEHNGVEITVPVKYGSQFDYKAREFFSFWKKGTVLLNGEDPSFIEGTEVCPNVFSVPGLEEDYVVMGNVAYPVNNGLYAQNSYKDFGVVAYVAIGDVNFAPSREALQYTPKTNATIERIRKDFNDGLIGSIQADINASADHAEAIVRHHKWTKMLGYHMPKGMTFQGDDIPTAFSVYGFTYEPDRYRRQVSSVRQVHFEWLPNATIITGFDKESISTVYKQKIKQLAEDFDLNDTQFILVEKPFGDKWLAKIDTVTWDDVKAVKLDNGPRKAAGPRGKQSYKRWDASADWWVDDDVLSTTAKIVYFSPAEKVGYRQNLDYDHARALTKADPDVMIVMLGMNRWDKFKRQFTQAVHIKDYVKGLLPGAVDLVTAEDKEILSFNSAPWNVKDSLRRLDETKIDDPALVAAIEATKSQKDEFSDGYKRYQTLRNLGRLFNMAVPDINVPTFKNPLDAYPLVQVSAYNKGIHAHNYLYINAAFAAAN